MTDQAPPAATLAAWLLAWYQPTARDLPWRGETDPYRIWVSEIMLQQTQVAVVRDYYHRFLARFPTVAALAAAELEEVLAVWQGLGYYRRARGLHAAARVLAAEHDGSLPANPTALRRLPGVGDYTAGAIASIGFGLREPAVDGNVARVVCRLLATPGDPRRGETRRRVDGFCRDLLAGGDPGAVNQALMDLGATVCTPTNPACSRCPWLPACRAAASGQPERFPELSRPGPPRERLHVCAWVVGEAGWLFGRRPERGRWGGLWELPRLELPIAADAAAALAASLPELLGVAGRVEEPVAAHHHAISGERIRLVACPTTLAGEPRPLVYEQFRWVPDGAIELPTATAQRRLIAALGHQPLPGTVSG